MCENLFRPKKSNLIVQKLKVTQNIQIDYCSADRAILLSAAADHGDPPPRGPA